MYICIMSEIEYNIVCCMKCRNKFSLDRCLINYSKDLCFEIGKSTVLSFVISDGIDLAQFSLILNITFSSNSDVDYKIFREEKSFNNFLISKTVISL